MTKNESLYPLGELIQQVREIVPYNPNLPLKGLSSEKCFVDIDIKEKEQELKNKKFQLVKKDQFCYISQNLGFEGEAFAISINDFCDRIIVNGTYGYICFEVIEKKTLLPKYLMLYFLTEKTGKLIRRLAPGTYSKKFYWKDLCNLLIRVPPPPANKKS